MMRVIPEGENHFVRRRKTAGGVTESQYESELASC